MFIKSFSVMIISGVMAFSGVAAQAQTAPSECPKVNAMLEAIKQNGKIPANITNGTTIDISSLKTGLTMPDEKERAELKKKEFSDEELRRVSESNKIQTSSTNIAKDLNLPIRFSRVPKSVSRALRADIDGDSAISLAEFLVPLDKGFNLLDTNKDGQIAIDEVGEKHARRLIKYDKDGDKAVSLEEFVALAKERFAKVDADGNGKLEVAELLAGAPRRA